MSTDIAKIILGIVVGIDKNNSIDNYRVLIADITKLAPGTYEWKFDCKMMDTMAIIASFSNSAKWLNIKLENNKIKGSTGSLDRFNQTLKDHKPYVILSQLMNSENRLLGYKIADYNGKVRNIPLKEMLAYGNRVTKAGGVPVQNAIFVPAENDKREHYKSYPNHTFLTEIIVLNTKEQRQVRKVPIQKNEKTLSKLEEIYNKDQITQLKLGKQQGLDIRVFANPALSAEQMYVLREAMKKNLNVKALAFPEFEVKAMKYYVTCLEDKINIKRFINPKYSIGQLSELSIAEEQGLDLVKMLNPKLTPNEMAEIRERLENNIWKDWFVKPDGKWD